MVVEGLQGIHITLSKSHSQAGLASIWQKYIHRKTLKYVLIIMSLIHQPFLVLPPFYNRQRSLNVFNDIFRIQNKSKQWMVKILENLSSLI